ncbi:hypothetical protein C671_2797 [[Clostridium] bifermentans ATCC 19299]|uniref:hypothetical protein n=1 Tax=Paraclostridium bifermentans TaxID=1490 RepID=UPI00038CED45|nr:hypothetical protein [Paraclostridium bifermentans]EQK41151.1 hypothetical protein C671_2797 [[Clostridium] bifermentans ATCC 19299] [Paraclostridium bifermentans ATCC 19299]
MEIITVKDKNVYSKHELDNFNNLADKPTQFIKFVCFLCKKYKLNLSEISESNYVERNLGVELIGEKILIQFFYEYDSNTLELVVSADFDKTVENNIRKDIWTYVKTVNYKKGDRVIDIYGEKYIVQENIEPSHTVTKQKVTSVSDNTESWVINQFICPDLD